MADAKADPPPMGKRVATDLGAGLFGGLTRRWWNAGTGMAMDPQPKWWCDPRPPVESEIGPLTMGDLWNLAYPWRAVCTEEEIIRARERLRHAIAALESENHVTPHDDEKVVKP